MADKPMKPEDVLQVIAAARGDAICVPTMTTSPRRTCSSPGTRVPRCVR